MPSVRAAAFSSWTIDPFLFGALLITALIYARGWSDLHRQMPARFPLWRLGAFAAGLATLALAIASPLDAFAGLLLQVHMVQHLLLMTVAPPLLLLGAPTVPLLRGLPAGVAKSALGPFLAWPLLRRIGETLVNPVVSWLAMAAATWIWHLPVAYQLALRSPLWHGVEHATFAFTGLLFWWPVVQPWPSVARWPRWTMVPYLLLADFQNTALAALLTFSDRVLYPFYDGVPRLNGITPLADQTAAGALMWVPMSVIYLVPAVVITARLLSPRAAAPAAMRSIFATEFLAKRPRLDLLALPWIGSLVRMRYFRPAAQSVLFVVATAVIADGFVGPQASPMNLAGVLPWTHWRGLTVIALLTVGNLFCMACPFMLPRALARRLGLARWSWPRRWRSKWPAVVLLLGFFCAYEVFALWDSPWWTAALILSFFAASLVVDTFFRGASFCKYVCPIGQFHFVQSLVSPFEIAVRRPDACARCATHDCLRGNATHRGCELELFLPRKSGNLDCTLCLDCVRACPHDNVGLMAGAPGRDLLHDGDRSSLGRLSRRPDVAAVVTLLVFAAFAVAGAMIAPVTTALTSLSAGLGAHAAQLGLAAWIIGLSLIVPLLTVTAAAAAGRAFARLNTPVVEIASRFVLGLIPLGAAMWAAHFLLHFVAGWRSALPALQRAAADAGIAGLGAPQWSLACAGTPSDGLLRLELLLLDLGLLLSLYVTWRIARSYCIRLRPALTLLTPWVAVAVALYAGGAWVLLQPMQMRGLMGQ